MPPLPDPGTKMNYSLILLALAVSFFLLLLGAIALGKRFGRGGDEKSRAGAAAIEASVFALLGLLLAFTFSGAAQRMAERRNVLVQEVNAIGTAWLRIDLLAAGAQPALRDDFRRYVDERILYYRNVTDFDARDAIAARATAAQQSIWRRSMQAAQDSVPPYAASYVAAVNEMFDVATTQTVTQKVHPPMMTYAFLGLLALVSAGLVGMTLAAAGRTGLTHPIVYALVMTSALYIIVDYEFPRVGTIRIDQSDALLVAQRASMVNP